MRAATITLFIVSVTVHPPLVLVWFAIGIFVSMLKPYYRMIGFI